jgi:riboflavin synthase
MFTGIVTHIGTIRAAEQRGDLRVVIDANGVGDAAIGASISCSGVCLTVVDKGSNGGADWFAVDVSSETVSKTANRWEAGTKLNLERALKLGDELGGHIVTGHVDGVGTVKGLCPEGDSTRVGINAPASLAPYLAAKGSITVDGVSLTVNEIADQPDGSTDFALNIIPHTAAVTTLGGLKQGDPVNLEIDVLARYLSRMEAYRARTATA